MGKVAGDAFAILGEFAIIMQVAGTVDRKADRGAVHLDVGERQSGHCPFVAVAMQVDDEAQVSSGVLRMPSPIGPWIGKPIAAPSTLTLASGSPDTAHLSPSRCRSMTRPKSPVAS